MPQDNTTTTFSFYVTGGTLAPDAPSYLPRVADAELLDALSQGELCYILNARQMGKSSLCLRVRQALHARSIRTAFLDLQKFGSSATPEQWYNSLLQRIGLDLKLRAELLTYWRANLDRALLDRLFGAITDVALARDDSPLVIFLDEVDVVRSLPFPTDEFFGAIRESYNERAVNPDLRRLTFCLVGSALQADLVADTRLSPFNVGRQLDLQDFTLAEMAPLTPALGANGAAVIARVHHWTGGHPFLTQSVCAEVAAAATTGATGDGPPTPACVDAVVADEFLTRMARRDVVHLADVSNRMLSRKAGEIDPADDRQKADILALYEQIWRKKKPVLDDECNPFVGLLKLSGIVRSESGVLKMRNRIYERVFDAAWIAESRPDAEVRRQRAAVARARLQVGSMAAGVLIAMAGLLWRTSQAEKRANAETKRAVQAAALEHAATQEEKNQKNAADVQARLARVANQEAKVALKAESQAKVAAIDSAQKEKEFAIAAQKQASRADLEAKRSHAMAAVAAEQTIKAKANAATIGHLAYVSAVGLADRSIATNNYRAAQRFFDQAASISTVERGFEWNYLQQRLHPEKRLFVGHHGGVIDVAVSRDGERLLTCSWDATARVWDAHTGKTLVVLNGHRSAVTCGVFSPDGKRIVTGSLDRTVQVWDAHTGRCLNVLRGSGGGVSDVSFSPDGTSIAAACDDDICRIWNVSTGNVSVELNPIRVQHVWYSMGAYSVAFAPDGKHVVVGYDDGTARIFDPTTAKQELTLDGRSSAMTAVTYSPDGRLVVTCNRDGTCFIWNALNGNKVSEFGTEHGGIWSVAFSPDGSRFATGHQDTTACIWDLPEFGKTDVARQLCSWTSVPVPSPPIALRGHTERVTSVAFARTGTQLFTGSYDGTARAWDFEPASTSASVYAYEAHSRRGLGLDFTEVGSESKLLRGHASDALSVAFSPDGQRIVTGMSDNTARIWDAKTYQEMNPIVGASGIVSSVSFSPSSKQILTGSTDGTVRVCNAETGALIMALKQDAGVTTAGFDRDGGRILSCSENGTVCLWDARTGKKIHTIQVISDRSDDGSIVVACLSPDGKHIATGGTNGTIRTWSVEPGGTKSVFGGNNARVTSIVFSPDGTKILSSSEDHSARLWDVASNRELLVLDAHDARVNSVAFSRDGRRLLTGSDDGKARIWDASTGRELVILEAGNRVNSATFSPDGETAVTVSSDGVMKIWQRASAEQAATLGREAEAAKHMLALPTLPINQLAAAAKSLALQYPYLQTEIADELNDAAKKVVNPSEERQKPGSNALALQLAGLSLQYSRGSNGEILDTLAAAQFACGDLDAALATERKAVAQLPTDKDLAAALKRYEGLAAARGAGTKGTATPR